MFTIDRFIQYIQLEKRYSAHTVESYKNDLDQFDLYVKTHFELESLNIATHQLVRSWVVELIKTNYSSKSVNRKLSALKSYYRFLKRHAQIKSNPAAKIIGPKKPQRLPTYIRERDMEQGLAVLVDNEFSAIRDRIIIELFYVTGMRRSELIELSESSINFGKMELKIVGKGNKERIVPISKEVIDLLRQYLALRNERWTQSSNAALLLTDKGKPLYPKLVYNIVKNWLSRVSTAQKLSPHVLRHSFATHLADRGAELNAIKELLGHASLAATEVYMHNTIEKLKGVYKGAHPRA